MPEDNSHAGQGAVLLDIGGDVGALIVTMPSRLLGVEIEIRPAGTHQPAAQPNAHEHEHAHEHAHSAGHDHVHLPHVAVVARPSEAGPIPTAVFAELREGDYELYERPTGAVAVVATVRGGEVTEANWPA